MPAKKKTDTSAASALAPAPNPEPAASAVSVDLDLVVLLQRCAKAHGSDTDAIGVLARRLADRYGVEVDR